MMGLLCNTFTLYVLENYTKMITKGSSTFDIKSLQYIFPTHAENCNENTAAKICTFSMFNIQQDPLFSELFIMHLNLLNIFKHYRIFSNLI